jgi:general secretion pathway protein G
MARNTRTGSFVGHYAGVLAGLALVVFLADGVGSIVRAKESVLKQNLYNLRSAIDQYTMDKQRAPENLRDLVAAGYFRSIPIDPMTETADWQTTTDETLQLIDRQEPGITDVHSRSQRKARDGSRYESW